MSVNTVGQRSDLERCQTRTEKTTERSANTAASACLCGRSCHHHPRFPPGDDGSPYRHDILDTSCGLAREICCVITDWTFCYPSFLCTQNMVSLFILQNFSKCDYRKSDVIQICALLFIYFFYFTLFNEQYCMVQYTWCAQMF